MKVLQLLPSLGYNGAAKQAFLLGRSLAGICDLHVCALRDLGPWAESLRAAGITVHCLEWTRPLDPLPLWRLHHLLNDLRPDRIHVWRLPALRALALAGRKYLARSLVSEALPRYRLAPALSKLDRWLLARVDRILAGGATEECALQRLGVARVAVVPPGVELHPGMGGTEGSGRRVVCVGNLERNKGFREAVRAADYLTYPFPDVHLEVIGAGPFRPALERFQQSAYYRHHIHLGGPRHDAAAWLAGATMCWVPSLTATGRQVALEAMAAARPVIASDLPHFREIIVDGVSGLLVPPGDKTALACRSRQLLLDDDLRHRLGQAALARVRDHFKAADFKARIQNLYGL